MYKSTAIPVYDKSILSEYPCVIKDQVEGEDGFDKTSLLAYIFRRNVERRGFRLVKVECQGKYHNIYKICKGDIEFAYVQSFNYRISPFPEFGVIQISDSIIPEYLSLHEPVVSLTSFMEDDPHGPVLNDLNLQAYICSLHKKHLKNIVS